MDAGKIEVTGVPLEALVRAAYNPSQPRGLGLLSFQPGDLSDEEVAKIVDRGTGDRILAVSMDYVKGRSCKFQVRRIGERLFINNRWYDHSDGQLRELLTSVGLSPYLVDKAREEEARYIESAIALAVGFLKERGGSYVDRNRGDEELPSKIFDGLIHGSVPPGQTIKRNWDGIECHYSLDMAATVSAVGEAS